MRVVHANSSWRDQLKIVEYLDSTRPGDTARRFLVALDDTIKFIAEFPDLGNPWEWSDKRNSNVRFRLVKRFKKYLVLYRRLEDHVVILRVFHGSQDIESELSEWAK